MTSSDRCLQPNVSIVEDEKYMFDSVERSEQRFIQVNERIEFFGGGVLTWEALCQI